MASPKPIKAAINVPPGIKLPDFTTPATEELCKDIAKKSKGVAFLGFSRGKDSLCAWLNLRRYFKKVIPFHCASYPRMKHVTAVLDYYERKMETKILRLVGEELPLCLSRLIYQEPDMAEGIEEHEIPLFSKIDVVEELRYDFNYPNAWCAFGISANDSIDRLIYCRKTGGQNESNLTFYPCWDWPRAEILKAVRNSGLRLSGEYRWTSRTLGSVPSATVLNIMKEHYREDYERALAMYPLAEAKILRERYLVQAWERRKSMGIVDDEQDGSDDGTDVMPELGMDMASAGKEDAP